MTLDFSHTSSVFDVNPPDCQSFYSRMRFEDRFIMDDRTSEFCFDYDDMFDCTDRGDSCEANDLVDLLPADPFGMNIGALNFTALLYEVDDALSFMWNEAWKFPPDPELNDNFRASSICNATQKPSEVDESCSDPSGGDHHEALSYVVGYLGVRELLSVEGVCRSLRDAVQNDPLLWRNVVIDQPLNERIDDDALVQITSRAQGNLQCLSLLKCSRVTDDGLRHVLGSNPRLNKLCVPECTRLTVDGIVSGLKDFVSSGSTSLRYLRIGGRYDVTNDHFQELKVLLGIDEYVQSKAYRPRIYHGGHSSFSYDDENDDRVIDIDICPRCQNSRLVYDCPIHNCQDEHTSNGTCKACTICIARCIQCGRCVNGEYVETFCLDIVCLDCCDPKIRREEHH